MARAIEYKVYRPMEQAELSAFLSGESDAKGISLFRDATMRLHTTYSAAPEKLGSFNIPAAIFTSSL